MRVALVSPYALSLFGGVQEQTLAMSRELASRGHQVLIVAPGAGDERSYDTPATIRRFGHPWSWPANGSRAPLTLSPLATRRAWFAVEHFSPDVVHFHEPFAPLIGWGVLRTHRVPAVGTFHRSGGGPALALTRPLLGRLARDLDATVAVSSSAATTINRACGLEPTVLYNGLETSRFTEFARERSDDVVLVCVGRLEKRKGVATAIRAVISHNARSADPWRLVVVGEGTERVALEEAARGDASVHFVGAVGEVEKRRWLRRASAVLCPALHGESFGLVVLEAMASEVPAVVSDIPGYREAAHGHATLFAPGDDRALERAITTAIEGANDETLAAARRHAEGWSMVSLCDAYEAIYASARERFDGGR